jgi:plasmid maintenance system antidote protein VapI
MLLQERDWSRERVAIVLEVQTVQVLKYLGGHRRVTPTMRTKLLNEFGEQARDLIALCDEAFEANRSREKTPRPKREKRETYTPPIYNGPRYTIDEWVKRFGRPGGGGPDINGRYSGFFDTEPCWLGE